MDITDIYSMGHCTKYCTIGAISLGPCKVPLLLWPPDTTLLLYIITLSSNRLWHTLVSVVCVCGYANASAISQEEIKEDNSSSNSFLLHPSVMLTTVHILEMEMHLLLRVCKCVLKMLAQTRVEKKICLFIQGMPAWAVLWSALQNEVGRRQNEDISFITHTRGVTLCVERRLIYSTEQLLSWRRNRRREKEQYKIKPCLLFWIVKFPISHHPALEWKQKKKIYPNVFITTELLWLTESTVSCFYY